MGFEYQGQAESSIDDVPRHTNVQTEENFGEAEEDKADEFVFDHESMNWVPKTLDVRKMGGKQDQNGEYKPNDLLMSDTNILAMRVPNFSYAGEADLLRKH